MEYNRDGLFARKSWFILNDKIFCLGSGIASTGMLPVTTSINQCYLNGKVVINKAGNEHISMEDETIHDPTWIVHDNIGYFFPNGGNIRIETKSVEGSWHRVSSRYPDKKIYDRLFKLWFRTVLILEITNILMF